MTGFPLLCSGHEICERVGYAKNNKLREKVEAVVLRKITKH